MVKSPTGEHWVCGIAYQHEAAAGPGWDRIAVEERPSFDARCFSGLGSSLSPDGQCWKVELQS